NRRHENERRVPLSAGRDRGRVGHLHRRNNRKGFSRRHPGRGDIRTLTEEGAERPVAPPLAARHERLAHMPASRSSDRSRPHHRRVTIDPGFVASAEGSCLISVGKTRVICTAAVSESVPRWMTGRGKGWVTAEYAMLPASTGERKQRDVSKGKQDGRGVEI